MDYVRDGVASAGLGEGGAEDAPGVRFFLSGERLHAHPWLIAGSPRFGRRDLGPLEVEFVVVRSREDFESRSLREEASGISLIVHRKDGGAPCRIPLPASVGQEIPCGPDLVAKVEEFLLRARLVDGKLTDLPDVASQSGRGRRDQLGRSDRSPHRVQPVPRFRLGSRAREGRVAGGEARCSTRPRWCRSP